MRCRGNSVGRANAAVGVQEEPSPEVPLKPLIPFVPLKPCMHQWGQQCFAKLHTGTVVLLIA